MDQNNMDILDVKEMTTKWFTKGEVYKVLIITGNEYLPPEEQTNCDFIRDILWGDKIVSW